MPAYVDAFRHDRRSAAPEFIAAFPRYGPAFKRWLAHVAAIEALD